MTPKSRKIYTELTFLGDWQAYDDNYDGAADSHSPVGYGTTEEEAAEDLLDQLEDREAEWEDRKIEVDTTIEDELREYE